MRRFSSFRALVASLLVVTMVGSFTGLLGASGTGILITSPKAGARVSGAVDVQASIKVDADISYVILGVDDDRPYASNSAPYSFELDTRTLTDGPHRLYVEVYDRYGLVGSSKTLTVYVRNGSSAAVEAEEPAEPTRVAARPAANPPARIAARPDAAARTAASAATVERSALVSPAASSRGPLAAPVVATPAVTTALLQPAPARTGVRGHTVVLNGRPVAFDVAPYIQSERLHVGFRAMMETMGAEVSWSAETRTAKGVRGALRVEVPIGERFARVNGRKIATATPAVIRNGRTMMHVRLLASATGLAVHWDSETQTASVRATTLAIAQHRPLE